MSPGNVNGLKEVKFRSMFVAPKDHVLLSWDLSQAESWCVAYFANEPTMKLLLKENRFHEHTAAAIANCTEDQARADKNVRYIGKQANHSLAYRMSHLRYVQQVSKNTDGRIVLSNLEGKRHVDIWHSLYILTNWWNQIEFDLEKNGRTLVTPYGRIRTYFQSWGKELFKQATAGLPQSTVADHLNGAVHPELNIKGGLREVRKKFVVERKVIRLVNQSHDSFIAECPKGITEEVGKEVSRIVQRPLIINGEQFTIPVDCEVGERWGELEKMKL